MKTCQSQDEVQSTLADFVEVLVTLPLRLPLALAGELLAPARAELRRQVRRSLGAPREAPPRALGDEGGGPFLDPGAVARQVHGDLPSMVIGGFAALLLQSLHPLAMAGVAQHSSYKEDPIGRLRRTAAFIGATTFGSAEQAVSAIEVVREVHRHVRGRAPDGRRYAATDPELLTWVHVAEVHSFLAASERYGPRRLDAAAKDRYFAETAVVARALGARWVPESSDEVNAYFQRVRPELYAGRQALEARDFLLHGVSNRPQDRLVHAGVVAGALSVLPSWAKSELGIASVPLADRFVVSPVTRTFCAGARWTLRA